MLACSFPSNSLFDEQDILSSLSEPLRRDVIAHIAMHLINAVPLLRDANPGFLNAILPLLRNVMPRFRTVYCACCVATTKGVVAF